MADEVWTLGADPAELKLALGAVNKEIAENNRQWAQVAKAANMSAEDQIAAASRIHAAHGRLIEEKKKLISYYQQETTATGGNLQTLNNGMRVANREGSALGRTIQRSMSGANESIRSVSYGLDDFLTVASQQGGIKGFASGVSAAANNFSYLLGSIHPGLIIFPALAAAALKIGVNIYEASVQTKRLDDDIKKLGDSYKNLNNIAAKTQSSQGDNQIIMQAEGLISDATINRNILVQKVEKLKQKGGANFRESAFGEQIHTAEMDVLWIDDGIAKQRRAIADAKKRMAEREKKELADDEQKSLDAKFGSTKGTLKEVANQFLMSGMTPDSTTRLIREKLGIHKAINPNIEQGRNNYFQQIVSEASEDQLQKKLQERTANPLEKERRTIELEREQIELARSKARLDDPDGKFGKNEQREWQRRINEIDIKIREIDLKQREAAIAGQGPPTADKAQKTLEQIRDILSTRNLNGRGNE
jgi:hypothetical protein